MDHEEGSGDILMTAEFTAGLSIYMQIARSIETAILEGELSSGSRISSLREAAVEMGVNVNTIIRAYKHLEDTGIIIKQRGLGFFVSDDAVEIIRKDRREEFYKHTIPELAKTLEQLNIDYESLVNALKKAKATP